MKLCLNAVSLGFTAICILGCEPQPMRIEVAGGPQALTFHNLRESKNIRVDVFDADNAKIEQPELAADISERGIVMAGGSSLLGGFRERLRAETGMPVEHAESPLTTVAIGSGLALEEFDALARSDKVASKRNPRARAAATRV